MVNSSYAKFNKFLRIELENQGGSISIERNGVENSYQNLLTFCQRNRFFEALSDVGDRLTDDKGLLENIFQSLEGICPNERIDFSDNVLKKEIKSFNFEYDAGRCFSELSERIKKGDLITLGSELNRFMLVNGDLDPTYKNLGEKYYNSCLNVERALEETCLKEATQKGKAEILYKVLVDSGAAPPSGELTIERSERAMNLFVNRVVSDPAIWKCLEQAGNEAEAVSSCRGMATKHFERQKYIVRRGQKIFDRAAIATDALREDLSGLVTELDREISVFHWAESGILNGLSNDGPAPLNSVRANYYLRLRSSMFHTGPLLDTLVPDSDNGTNAGRGLYAAVDPNSTSRYGEALFEIRLPEGSRYLDLREKGSSGAIPLSRDTIKKLADAGCDLSKDFGLSQEADYTQIRVGQRIHIEKMAFEKEGRCHHIFSDVIRNLGVNFLSYGYDMELPQFCDQANQRGSAFVMIDIDVSGMTTQYNKLTIMAAIKANKENGTPIPEEIKKIMQIITHPLKGHREVNPNTSDTEVISYWKDRIFLCNGLKDEVLGK